MAYGVREREFSWFPGGDPEATRARLGLHASDAGPHLVDVTMLYAPRSGGVKRYLNAKRAWVSVNRPKLRHSLVVPGARTGSDGAGVVTLHAPPLPFGDGYRWPSNVRKWTTALEVLRPTVIEAGDPYAPGQAALEAGQACGVPVVGFCHSDPAALAALHLGEWAKRPVEKRWARLFCQFDRVVAPSRFIASRLYDAGVERVVCRPLGVDVQTFVPDRRDPAWLRRRLDLPADARVLVFAGRPAKEKNIDVLIEAVQRLGAPYVLVLVGAGSGLPAEPGVICLPYERDPRALVRLLSSCDAFVHANDREPFGLVVLEAMACGLPVVGVASGGVAETVDATVGSLAPSAAPEDFAEAVEALFDRDLAQLGQAARARAVELFAWERVFGDLGGLYAELSGEPAFTGVQGAAAH
ncbi:glycosyltransferase [Caulobacter sp. 17J80-11]|uniref:glycosyltransferase n=1 Tax=Caulobacter sp. 17J80-11 TaxID=2763502 RepID=UPI001653D1C8|nr:glycosyltransferase [Caulobacter sp. 17J80-11]MBC6980720.1 glycosyltransferase [Caulobacter sp. 17J80-11]